MDSQKNLNKKGFVYCLNMSDGVLTTLLITH